MLTTLRPLAWEVSSPYSITLNLYRLVFVQPCADIGELDLECIQIPRSICCHICSISIVCLTIAKVVIEDKFLLQPSGLNGYSRWVNF